MKLQAYPEIIAELKELAANPYLDIHSKPLKESKFYRMVQTATDLDAPDLCVSPKVVLLIAKLAAFSRTLHTINLSWNHLEDKCLQVVTALASSSTIHTLDISNNDLYEANMENIIEALAPLRTLQNLNIKSNAIAEKAVAVAKVLIQLPSLLTVNMSDNCLDQRQKLEIEQILKSHVENTNSQNPIKFILNKDCGSTALEALSLYIDPQKIQHPVGEENAILPEKGRLRSFVDEQEHSQPAGNNSQDTTLAGASMDIYDPNS